MNPSSIPALDDLDSQPFDLMRVPGLGRLFAWRYARPVLQAPLLVVSIVMILHGLFGPTLAPKNLATTLSWIHFRGVLVLVLLAAGNFFCLACPFMLVRQAARRFFKPRFTWPRMLRNKWISVALFVVILFTYELFDLWSSPWWTAWLIIAYFVTVLLVDGLFKHASFCKFVCPIGQFNFVASLALAFRSESAPAGCVRDLPHQGLHSWAARTRVGFGYDSRLRAGAVSAQQGGQYGLHLLPGLRPRLPPRQRRNPQPDARR